MDNWVWSWVFLGGVDKASFSKYYLKNFNVSILLLSKLSLDPKAVDFRHSKTIRLLSNQCLKAVLIQYEITPGDLNPILPPFHIAMQGE